MVTRKSHMGGRLLACLLLLFFYQAPSLAQTKAEDEFGNNSEISVAVLLSRATATPPVNSAMFLASANVALKATPVPSPRTLVVSADYLGGLKSLVRNSAIVNKAAQIPKAMTDFNGDGKSDILWQHTDGSVAMWLMNGLTMTSSRNLLLPGSGWSVAHTGDFNGDGKADLVWKHTDGSVGMWLINGLAMTSGGTLLGAGSGWSVTHTGDFDGDGKADLVWKHTDGSVNMWLMNGLAMASGRALLGAGSGWSVIHTGDFNGDGKTDLVWKHTDGSVNMWLMNGLAMASGRNLLWAGSGWSVTHTGDFDGDGKTDLLWQHIDGSVNMWLMNGLAMASGGSLLGPGSGWSVTHTGDFDGDGKSDLMWKHSDGTVGMWLMNGTTRSFAAGLAGGGGWSVTHSGDFDGDGKADLVWKHSDGSIKMWLMNGLTMTSSSTLLGAASGWSPWPSSPALLTEMSTQYVYDPIGRLTGMLLGSAAGKYTYDAVGNITAISRPAATSVDLFGFTPNAGATGSTVTIQGTGFGATPVQNTVLFNGNTATINSATANTISVTVPSGATSGPITVTSPNGTATSAFPFTVLPQALLPQISGFTPATGVAGTSVTITGSNFGTTAADNIVTFNSINATITAASATSVTATVPINATTGRVKVQTREGTATSTGLFVVPTGTFTAADVLSTQTIVVDGPSVTANVNVAGKVVQLIFDASAGQSLGLGIGPVSFLPTTGTAMVNVHAPDGTVIATLGVPSVGSSVQLKNLPLTGVYTIAFNTVSTATASASFTLSSSAYSAGTLVIDASPAAFSIPRQGQSGVISFSGTQGQWLALVVTGFPSTNYFEFTFVRPDGSTWFGYQSVTSGTVLALPILPTTGIYKIRMTPIGATIGSFTLALLSDQPGTISLGVVTTVNFDGSGRLLRYTFPWQANTPIAIEALGPTLNGYANISDSNGAAFSSINFFAGQSAMNTHGTSPAGGTYSMRVVRSTTANGSVSLRVGTADLIVEDIVPILGPDIYPPNGYPTVGNSHQASISIRNVGGAGVQFCSFQVFLSPNASGYPRTNLLGSFSSLTPTFAGQYCGSFYNLYLERAGIAAGVYYYVVELSPNDPVTTNNTLVKGPYNLRCFTCSVSN